MPLRSLSNFIGYREPGPASYKENIPKNIPIAGSSRVGLGKSTLSRNFFKKQGFLYHERQVKSSTPPNHPWALAAVHGTRHAPSPTSSSQAEVPPFRASFGITVDCVADSSILLLWIASSRITVDCVVDSPIRRYYYCGLLWIASSRIAVDCVVDSSIWLRCCCVLLVTLTLVLCFFRTLLRVSSLWHVLCCKFTMVSQPYCVWVLDKGVDVGS